MSKKKSPGSTGPDHTEIRKLIEKRRSQEHYASGLLQAAKAAEKGNPIVWADKVEDGTAQAEKHDSQNKEDTQIEPSKGPFESTRIWGKTQAQIQQENNTYRR